MIHPKQSFPIIQLKNGTPSTKDDWIITEGYLFLHLNGQELGSIPATPKEIDDLILGFLFLEGLLSDDTVPEIRMERNHAYITIPYQLSPIQYFSPVIDCFTGEENKALHLKQIDVTTHYSPHAIHTGIRMLSNVPSLYQETGGVHLAGLGEGNTLLYWAEDISRRTAILKVFGKAIRASQTVNRLSKSIFSTLYMVSTGRVSSDMLVQAIRGGIPCVCSLSAPTDKAIRFAERYKITLCGFVRGSRMNIYSHPFRIRGATSL
jgi:FdhD protein